MDVGDEILDEVQVIFLAPVDLAAERGWQRMVLVQHHRNLTVFRTEHNLNVQTDQSAQALFDAVDAAHHIDDSLLGDVHGMRHDVKQNLVLRLEVVIKPALGELERGGDVVHRSGIVPLLLKEAGGSAQDFLTWLDGSFAEHHQRWYRGMGFTALPVNLKTPLYLGESPRHRVQKFHVGTHGSIHALHFRVRGLDQVVLIGRVGTVAVPQPESAGGQVQRIAGENVTRPRSWTARKNNRIYAGISIHL